MTPRRTSLPHLDPAPLVGREGELEQLRAATAQAPSAVWVHGPLGIGRSTLVRDFVEGGEAPILWIDAELLPPSPEALVDALRRLDGCRSPYLVIDNVEALGALQAWFLREGLPRLPTDVRLIIIGRRSPDSRWLAQPALPPIQALPLRQLSREASVRFLSQAGLPADTAAVAADLTHGHPLLLRMIARHPALAKANPATWTDGWIDLLVGELPGEAEATALAVGSFVRSLEPDLIADLVGSRDRAAEAISWVEGLGLSEPGPRGVTLHPLLREIVDRDLRRRRPGWRDELFEHVRQFMVERLLDRRTLDRTILIGELLWLVREAPQIRLVFEGFDALGWLMDVPHLDEWPEIEALIEATEGPAELARFRAWQDEGSTRTAVVRDVDGRWLGFVTYVFLTRLQLPPGIDDPASAALLAEVRRTGGLRPGEVVQGMRFWAARDTGWEASPVQARLFLHVSEQAFLTPNQLILAGADDPTQDRIQAMSAFSVRKLAEYAVGDRPRIWIGHHWREHSLRQWLDEGTRVALGTPQGPAPTLSVHPVAALERKDFEAEATRALRQARRPERLKRNPLIYSRFVLDRMDPGAGPTERVDTLLAVLAETAADVDPEGLLNAAWLTGPARKQRALALEFRLPYSTFRNRLRKAEARWIERLWHLDLGG